MLYYRNGEWVIEDQKSTNGLRLGDRRYQELVLQDGKEFSLGRLEALFRIVKVI
jgi:pSer/pThr/pTyr-binding forkhead associated (FHA) protein